MIFDKILMEITICKRSTVCSQQHIGTLQERRSGRNQRKLYRPMHKRRSLLQRYYGFVATVKLLNRR